MAIKPEIVAQAENNRRIEQKYYEDSFIKQTQAYVSNQLNSPPKYNMQAMTFFARSQEEMEAKIEDWLRHKYVERLHIPKKKRWWELWK